MMSGSRPQCSNANMRPVRPQPVATSSHMSSVPWRRHRSCTPCRKPSSGMMTLCPGTHSTMTAAVSSRASTRSSPTRSPAATSSPASKWPKPSRNSSLPMAERAPSVSPCQPPVKWVMRSRPVAARANLRAASTASVPELQKYTASRWGGVRCTMASARRPDSRAQSICTMLGRSMSSTSRMAPATTGLLRPTAATPNPPSMSRYRVPSRSHRYAPSPREYTRSKPMVRNTSTSVGFTYRSCSS